ncbi:MAG: hypothetical protein P8P98_02205 [Emcibacteraceae bacterium]|nr:hypothetical protein [Emcibacteraceae bacterium]
MQASYESRADSIEEQNLLLSLSSEAALRLEQKQQEYEVVFGEYNQLVLAIDLLYGENDDPKISNEMCRQISRAHILNWSYSPLSTIEEIVVSGKMSLLKNSELRQTIIALRNDFLDAQYRFPLTGSRATNLSSEFPDFIQRIGVGQGQQANCEPKKMRESRAFENEIRMSTSRKTTSFKQIKQEIELLNQIKQLIDKELALTQESAS